MEFVASASVAIVGTLIIISAIIFHLLLMGAVVISRFIGVLP